MYLKDGRIVDSGTYDELIERCDAFSEQFILELQKEESAEAGQGPEDE